MMVRQMQVKSYLLQAKRRHHRAILAKKVDTHAAFSYHWWVWRLTGIQPPKKIPPAIYNVYAILLNLGVTLAFPLTLIANLYHTRNQRQLCENLSISVTDALANFKFVYVWFVRHRLLLIRQMLQKLDGRAQHPEERKVLQAAVGTAQLTFRTFGLLYAIGISLSVVKLIFTWERSLIYPAWFYVDWRRSYAVYATVCVYQFLGLVVQAVQNCANDSYPPAYLCVLTAHMRALELRVRRLGLSQNSDSHLLVSKRAAARYYQELLACIEDHQELLR